MSTKNIITGGAFQDAQGNVLANGHLDFKLSQDASTPDGVQVTAGYVVRINLDANGNVISGQSIWPNDVLQPANTFYNVTGYSAQGNRVWGPNAQQVLSAPSPYNLGAWIPGSILLTDGYVTTYNIGVFLPGSYTSSQYYLYLSLDRIVRFANNMGPSTAVCSHAPVNDVTMTLLQNGVQFGTLVFPAGQTTGVYTTNSNTTIFAVNDKLQISMPATVDAQILNIGVVLSGTTVS